MFSFFDSSDESTDMRETVQLLIFIRMFFKLSTAKAELLGMISLEERKRGGDIFNSFKKFLTSLKVPLFKWVSKQVELAP